VVVVAVVVVLVGAGRCSGV